MIVADASIIANALGDDDSPGRAARRVLEGDHEILLPDFADVEVVSVFRKRLFAGTMTGNHCLQAIRELIALPFPRFPASGLLERAFELRDNLTVYDAIYVALAEALGCELVTADARLARAPGVRCPVRVITNTA